MPAKWLKGRVRIGGFLKMYSRIRRILRRAGKTRCPAFANYLLLGFLLGDEQLLAAAAEGGHEFAFKVLEHLHAAVGLLGTDEDLAVVLLEKGERLLGH